METSRLLRIDWKWSEPEDARRAAGEMIPLILREQTSARHRGFSFPRQSLLTPRTTAADPESGPQLERVIEFIADALSRADRDEFDPRRS
jgi:hypothetical protein